MKKILSFSILVLLLSTSISFGQDYKEEIGAIFTSYFSTVENSDNEATLDYMYPPLFDKVPRSQMLYAMNQMKEDTSTLITMNDAKILGFSKNIKVKGVQHAIVDYTFKMTMKIMEPGDAEADCLDMMGFIHENLNAIFGEDNVSYKKGDDTFVIQPQSKMYAIKSPKHGDWKFMEKKESLMPIVKKLLHKKVIKKLK